MRTFPPFTPFVAVAALAVSCENEAIPALSPKPALSATRTRWFPLVMILAPFVKRRVRQAMVTVRFAPTGPKVRVLPLSVNEPRCFNCVAISAAESPPTGLSRSEGRSDNCTGWAGMVAATSGASGIVAVCCVFFPNNATASHAKRATIVTQKTLLIMLLMVTRVPRLPSLPKMPNFRIWRKVKSSTINAMPARPAYFPADSMIFQSR